MTKTVVVLLGAGFVALVIVIAILVRSGCSGTPPKSRVEITGPKDTQVFAKLPDEDEQPLGEAPLTVDVRVDATIILRCKDREKTFPPDTWKAGSIHEPSFCPEPPPRAASVSINAVPWAEVFIKKPGTDRFVKPPGKESNITPIRGGLKVPIGTAIKLVYGDKEKTFRYEAWKKSNVISHDFLKP